MNRQEHLLTIAMEECAEVAQRISKALRFGLMEVQRGQPLTNANRINFEFDDLIAVMEMLEDLTGEHLIQHNSWRIMQKKANLETWLEYSKTMGTLTE